MGEMNVLWLERWKTSLLGCKANEGVREMFVFEQEPHAFRYAQSTVRGAVFREEFRV